MALEWVEGFDDGFFLDQPGTPWSSGTSASEFPVSTYSRGQFGRQCRIRNDQNRYITRDFSSSSQAVVGFRFNASQWAVDDSNRSHWQFHNTSDGVKIGLLIISGRIKVSITNPDGAPVARTWIIETGTLLQLNTEYYIEWAVTFNDTTGSTQVWVDGESVGSASNTDTIYTGASQSADRLWIRGTLGSYYYIDDVYVQTGTNTPYGPIVVETLYPNGNGNSSNFTGSDGNSTDNYLLVDEANETDGDTTYVESTTITDRDSYTFDNLSADADSVLAVVATASVSGEGAAANAQLTTRISATDYDGSTQAVPSSYGTIYEVWENSPATASAWTVSEVNGAEFGVEHVT